MFAYDSVGRFWKPHKKGVSVGRLTFVPPSTQEIYYMRILLNVQVGCTCFEDIRTVDGCVYETFRDACRALGLLANDREFIDAINEVSVIGSGHYIRNIFANMLLSSSMGDPFNVWENIWEIISDVILYEKRRLLNSPDLAISPDDLKQLCLLEIDKLLRPNGKTLEDYECMPKINMPTVEAFNNTLNEEQLLAYKEIVHAVDNNLGRMFFIDGFGGSGKTYLWNALSFRFRSEDKIVLNVASSGIASLLLPGGRTTHSQFGIPLVLSEESCCRIEKNSKKAELLVMTSLIIWDEAPMVNRWAFEALDRSLRDIMNKVVDGAIDLPFGGKTIVFGGDFRQILPVVPKGGRADIVHETINSSPLWRHCRVLKLTKIMRLQFSTNNGENKLVKSFANLILDIGDGKLGEIRDGEAVIEIPADLCVIFFGNHVSDIVESIYPQLLEKCERSKLLSR